MLGVIDLGENFAYIIAPEVRSTDEAEEIGWRVISVAGIEYRAN